MRHFDVHLSVHGVCGRGGWSCIIIALLCITIIIIMYYNYYNYEVPCHIHHPWDTNSKLPIPVTNQSINHEKYAVHQKYAVFVSKLKKATHKEFGG